MWREIDRKSRRKDKFVKILVLLEKLEESKQPSFSFIQHSTVVLTWTQNKKREMKVCAMMVDGGGGLDIDVTCFIPCHTHSTHYTHPHVN